MRQVCMTAIICGTVLVLCQMVRSEYHAYKKMIFKE